MLLRFKRPLMFSVVTLAAALGVGLSLGDVPKPIEGQPPVVKRVYDVADLLGASADPKDVDAGLDRVKNVIIQNVDNASWKDNGGDTGSITQFNRELIVMQTQVNQDEIKDLLQTLREQGTGRRTVVFDAYWVWLTPDQLKPGVATVPAELLADPKAVYRHVRLTGIEGERNLVGKTRPGGAIVFPTSNDPTTRPDTYATSASASSEPVVMLSEVATVFDEGTTIVATVDSSITAPKTVPATSKPEPAAARLAPASAPLQPPAPAQAPAEAPQPELSLQTHTTVRLRSGIPMIVSGADDIPNPTDGRMLCLVICAAVAK